jgi:hypothetical protein
MVEILDVLNQKNAVVEIVPAGKAKLPLTKDGWNFDWKLIGAENTYTYILRLVETPNTIEGILQIRVQGGCASWT